MSHVTTETATVYRVASTRKRYFSKRWAYYNAAKAMMLQKYPNDERGVGEYYEKFPERLERRLNMLITGVTDSYTGEYYEDFNSEKWARMVNRVARFLKFRDNRCSACDSTALIECKDKGKLIGMGCTECGAMFDVKGKQ